MKIAMAAIVLGFVMLLLSGVWISLFRANSSWTDEKAERSVVVKARLAELGAKVNGQKKTPGGISATTRFEFEELQKENNELNAEFESVHDRPQTTAKILKWSGLSIAILGLAGWYAVSQSR